MRDQCLTVVFGLEFYDQTVGVVAVSEIGCSANARSDADRQLTYLKPMETKMALAGISHGGVMMFPRPMLQVFIARLFFPWPHGSIHGPVARDWRALGRSAGVKPPEIASSRPIGTRIEAVSAADAPLIVNNYYSVRPLPRCFYWANGRA